MSSAASGTHAAKPRRSGSTLLGMVLGLLIGLGIALGVAMYVAKVPMPFVDKTGVRRTPEQEASEAERLRNWDPNAGLTPRSANRADPDAPAEPHPTRSAAGAVQPAGSAPLASVLPVAGPRASAPAATASRRDPAAILAGRDGAPAVEIAPVQRSARDPAALLAGRDPGRATPGEASASGGPRPAQAPRPAAAATPTAPTPAPEPAGNNGGPVYYVQAGAYSSSTEAEQQRARLAMQGFDGARVHVREVAGRTVYRVRIGPFDGRDEAERLRDKLSTKGTDAIVAPVQRMSR